MQTWKKVGRRTRDLHILNLIAEALNSAPDAQQALERTLALVGDLLGLRTGWVWLLDPETEQFYAAAVLNLPPYLQEPVRMTGEPCWCIKEFRRGRLTPQNIRLLDCSRLYPAVQGTEAGETGGLSCHACIPLYFRDRPLGIMNITAPSWQELSTEELRLLSTIAYQVGIALERARLAEESTRLARTEERARIAREIHDTLAQGLTAIALHLEAALPHLASDPDRARKRLERALETTRHNLQEARRSVISLRAAPLDGKPLPEALGALCRRFSAESGIRARVAAEPDGHAARDLPLTLAAEFFRIAQEALTNVSRHSGATDVTVRLCVRDASIVLSIRDNGCGFDPSGGARAGQGILGMRERTRSLGGKLRLRSRPGRGTTVTVEAPLLPEGPI